jgi:hypothetical protein
MRNAAENGPVISPVSAPDDSMKNPHNPIVDSAGLSFYL